MLEPDPTHSRVIPDPGFAGDDGAAQPDLARALAAWDRDPAAYADALGALREARVLVPVVAVLGEVEIDEAGLTHDKSSDMATVLVQGADGRLALLAFSGTEALAAWSPDARPVPVTTAVAARSALLDGAAALVLDLAGPVRFVVEGEDLRGLAEGWEIARVGGDVAWIRPGGESSASIRG
ncbi:SseB family protein [Nocardioides sp. MAH-18]|uniref:SseB family protein n=1 Tax=Nocardioides agri TaxID=2682843 RepID=A0A6L6XM73_9ACTN|nr:SseB family protein [Nocardioides sp. CGMCC 1.13656]MBA2952983.1 SseB family protein [Nocardioides sp. CGMCC 1.13656]MVQ47853.1 SseB family protein [Nocardioides sp. MAH-18]